MELRRSFGSSGRNRTASPSSRSGGSSTSPAERYNDDLPSLSRAAELARSAAASNAATSNIPFIKRNLAPLSFVDVPDRDYSDGMLGVYELQRVELARDVFAWAYERSCQRYTVVRDALPQPDPLRLRNRDQLTEVVNAIVRDDASIDDTPIRALAAPLVAPDDLDDFIAMAISELSGLHEGNLARYRLRPSEFHRWRGRRREPPSS